jgi:NitT/TauT family transport system substrate-binding protein
MFQRALAIVILVAGLTAGFAAGFASPAAAQERLSVATVRAVENGPLFLALGRGYFQAEGLSVDLKFYAGDQQAAAALGSGQADLGAMALTAQALNLAGKGVVKAIAGQAREKRGFEGYQIVASNAAYAGGLRAVRNLAGRSVSFAQLGGVGHAALGRIAAARSVDFKSLLLKPQQTDLQAGQDVAAGRTDAAVLSPAGARDVLLSGQAKFIAFVSEVDEAPTGALFASAKALAAHRAGIQKFVRAYARGAADYAAALLRRDRYNKRVTDATSQSAAALIARSVYPDHAASRAVPVIEQTAMFVDPQARLDAAEITRQIAWFKTQTLVSAGADPRAAVDPGFIAR